MFDETQINKLRDAGLIAELHLEGPYKGGYSIEKPASIQGNLREGYEAYWGDDEILVDAPCSQIMFEGEKFIFTVWEFIPGPELGDFQEEFETLAACVESVLDYYFGDPERMNPKEYLEIMQRYEEH